MKQVPMRTKKTHPFDKLPTWLQTVITWIVVGGTIIFLVALLVIATGTAKPDPQMNFIANYDGVSHVGVAYDTIPKEYILSYRTCDGDNTFIRLKANLVKPSEKFHGNPCPTHAK